MSDDDSSLYTSQTNEDEDDLFDKTEAAFSASPAPPDEPILVEEGEQYERVRFLIEKSKIYSSILAEQLKEQNKKYHRPWLSKNADDSSKNSATGLVQPKLLTGAKLHEYQLEGVAWLISLYENGLNGILADDMGLGKTIQTIAFMAYLVENNVSGPFIIVGPLATLGHWTSEFKKYAPDIECVQYYGAKSHRLQLRQKYFSKMGLADHRSVVVITTYEMIKYDVRSLSRVDWKYMVVDEGHRLKNIKSVSLRHLKALKSSSKLLLSGTPLQNNISELWTLLNFLLPDIFSDLDMFKSWFTDPADKRKKNPISIRFNHDMIMKIHDILRPFLLRRMKSLVLKHLPPKREYVIYTTFTEHQMHLYEMIAQGKLREFLEEELLKSYDPKGKKGFRQRFERERGKTLLNDYKNEFTFDFSEYDDIFGDIEEDDTDESGQVRYRNTDHLDISDEKESQKQQKTGRNRKRKLKRTGVVPSKRQRKYDDEYQEYVRDKRRYLHKNMLNYQHSLRMSCGSSLLLNYPFNLTNDEELTNVLKYSAKMKSLEDLCKGLVARGHRTIIFSQFLGMLDIIEDWATQTMEWKVCRIDGQTPVDVRQEQMELFRTDESYPLFLLSTRSGGLGINLTSADTVILFDSDWNPQIDLQAMDRAHRIGQSRPVIVYRLAVRSSFEERVIQLANKKKELEQVVIEEGNFSGLLAATEAEESELYQERLHQQIVKLLKTVGSKNSLQLLRDDFEKFGPAYSPLADQEVLEKILDRTDAAYTNHETQQLGDFIVPIF